MTKIYLAASYARKNEMKGVRDVLVSAGHIVTSSWIDYSNEEIIKVAINNAYKIGTGIAGQDVDDICQASVLVMFTGDLGDGKRLVEYGIALALGMEVVVIGKRDNVYECLPIVWHHNSWDEFCEDVWRGAAIVEAENLVKDLFSKEKGK